MDTPNDSKTDISMMDEGRQEALDSKSEESLANAAGDVVEEVVDAVKDVAMEVGKTMIMGG